MLQTIVILSVLLFSSCVAIQQNVSNRGKCFLVAASELGEANTGDKD